MASLTLDALPVFNLILSLRLAQTYKQINALESSFILKSFVELPNF